MKKTMMTTMVILTMASAVAMAAPGQKLMTGEQLPLCGMCMSYGKLMMADDESDTGHEHPHP